MPIMSLHFLSEKWLTTALEVDLMLLNIHLGEDEESYIKSGCLELDLFSHRI